MKTQLTKQDLIDALGRAQVGQHILAREQMQACLGAVSSEAVLRHHAKANQLEGDALLLRAIVEIIRSDNFQLPEELPHGL